MGQLDALQNVPPADKLVLALPILPDRQERWRRFAQALLEGRRSECRAACRRLGVQRVVVWLHPGPTSDMALVYLEVQPGAPALALAHVPASALLDSFERWFCHQVLEIHGLDLSGFRGGPPGELVLAWKGETG